MTDFTSTKANESSTSRANANTSIAHQSNQTGITDNRNGIINLPESRYYIEDLRPHTIQYKTIQLEKIPDDKLSLIQENIQSKFPELYNAISVLEDIPKALLYIEHLKDLGSRKVRAIKQISTSDIFYCIDKIGSNKLNDIITGNEETNKWLINIIIQSSTANETKYIQYLKELINYRKSLPENITSIDLFINKLLNLDSRVDLTKILTQDPVRNQTVIALEIEDLDIITKCEADIQDVIYKYDLSLLKTVLTFGTPESSIFKKILKCIDNNIITINTIEILHTENKLNINNILDKCIEDSTFASNFNCNLLSLLKLANKVYRNEGNKPIAALNGTVTYSLYHINSRHTYEYFSMAMIRPSNSLMDSEITNDIIAQTIPQIDTKILDEYQTAGEYKVVIAYDTETDSALSIKIIKSMFHVNATNWTKEELETIKDFLS
ncbi:hypothetical protein [Parabacteroides distasonis]|uniref:hypothetical protein n=1 Tax=Parabacteroides distasonis TaxID=823 RepID=UPI003219EF0F